MIYKTAGQVITLPAICSISYNTLEHRAQARCNAEIRSGIIESRYIMQTALCATVTGLLSDFC